MGHGSRIASGQRALHYWLAFFDSVRLRRAGRFQLAQEMPASLAERQADAQYTQAAQLLSM